MQVALYARVSTSTQQKQATIDSQLRKITEHISAQGWNLLNEHSYADDGISGARLDRPALDRLRDAAKRGEIDAVVILSPDRLARNYAHQWLLIEEFEKSNVQVIFLENPFGDSPQGKLLVQMQGMIAEYERSAIAERTRRGRIEKARRGEFIPWAYQCYGYRYIAKRPGLAPQVEIDEDEAAVIRQMFHWLITEQVGLRQIVKRLNEQKIATPSGKKSHWYISTVQVIVNNPVYMGQATFNRSTSVVTKRHRKPIESIKSAKSGKIQRPIEEWVHCQSPVIISAEIFEKAQLQLQRNREVAKRMYRPENKRYLLRSKVKCGQCGLAMTCISQGKQGGNYRYQYYRCLGKDPITHARRGSCPSVSIRAHLLEDLVWTELVQLLNKPKMIATMHQEWRTSKVANTQHLSAQLDSLTKRKERLEKQSQRLIDAYQEDVITLTELKARRKKMQQDIEYINLQLHQLGRQQHEIIRWQDLVCNIEKFTTLIGSNLDSLKFQDRQLIIQCLIDKIVVTGENVDIFYVFPFAEPPRLVDEAKSTAKEDLGNFYRLRLSDRGSI